MEGTREVELTGKEESRNLGSGGKEESLQMSVERVEGVKTMGGNRTEKKTRN